MARRMKHGHGVMTGIVVAAALLATSACSSSSPTELTTETTLDVQETAGVVFMTQNVVQDAIMDALFQGEVVVDEAGCLRAGDASGATVVWPAGYQVENLLGEIWIRDADGDVVGQVGASFSLGGGEVPYLLESLGFSQEDRDLAETRCPGKYWIVAP